MTSSDTSQSVLEYLYRDASNFKAHGGVLLYGQPPPGLNEAIRSQLLDGELFIPERIGVPSLQPVLWEYSGGPTADDHPWHEFVEVRPANPDDLDLPIANFSASEILDRFADAKRHSA